MTDQKQEHLRGVIPPVITPFDAEGKVDLGTYAELVDFWAGKVHGLFVCGTYGSGPLLDVAERKAVMETAVKAAAARLPVIAHVGATTTRAAVELARHAEAVGVKVVASVPPYYYPHSEDNVRRYFEALVRAVDIPVYCYVNPKTVGYTVSPAFLARLAELGVRGLKDSTFDIVYHYEVRRQVTASGFDFVAGSEALMLASWLAGARAFIAGLANCLPEPVVELYALCEAGRYEEAAEQQKLVIALRSLLHRASTVSMVHAILGMRGVRAGYPRAPFAPVDPEVAAEVKETLVKLGVL